MKKLLRVCRELLLRLNWRRRARMRLAKEFRDIVMAKAYDLHERAERNGAKEIGIPPDIPWAIEDFIWWMSGLCTFHERAVLAGKDPKLAAAEWASKMPPELRAAIWHMYGDEGVKLYEADRRKRQNSMSREYLKAHFPWSDWEAIWRGDWKAQEAHLPRWERETGE